MSEGEIKKMAREEFMNNVMKQLDSALIFTYIQNLENQLQQKENIIKEVREKIKEFCWDYDYETYSNMTSNEVKELVEILDKENKQ